MVGLLLFGGTIFFGTFLYPRLVVEKKSDEYEHKKDYNYFTSFLFGR